MKFTITEKKIQVSDEIKEYAERKVSKIDRFFRGCLLYTSPSPRD